MEGLPEKAAAAQSLRKPSPFVSGSPFHYNTCYRSSGRSRMFKLRLGLGFQTYARIPLLGALWTRVGLDRFVSSSSFSSSSASSSSSLCLRLHPPRYGLSLSLSLLPLEVSVYLSIFSARLPSNVLAIRQRQVQSCQHTKDFPGGPPTQY